MNSLSKIVMVTGLVASMALPSGEAMAWDISGDFRTHIFAKNWRDTRSGGESDSSGSAIRLRVRAKKELSDGCDFQTRFNTTVADEDNDWSLYIRAHRDDSTGVNPGTATLDEFFVDCALSEASSIRIGRMQSNLDSPQMASRSFDRSQASGVNIGWTDGIAYRYTFSNGWYGEATAQYNDPKGNGQTFRSPVNFSDDGSRVGFFGVVGSEEKAGPVFMRAFSLTVYPDALATEGLASEQRDDYILGAFKIGAGWDINNGRELIAIGEVAHAFNTPQKSVLGLPGEGEVDDFGWQFGADIRNIFPKHTMGINLGQSDAGMLVSNDFRQNNELFEYRWQYKATSALRFEFRARWRRELENRIDAPFLQRDRDFRVRMTYKF
jgi:hypothetical protein